MSDKSGADGSSAVRRVARDAAFSMISVLASSKSFVLQVPICRVDEGGQGTEEKHRLMILSPSVKEVLEDGLPLFASNHLLQNLDAKLRAEGGYGLRSDFDQDMYLTALEDLLEQLPKKPLPVIKRFRSFRSKVKVRLGEDTYVQLMEVCRRFQVDPDDVFGIALLALYMRANANHGLVSYVNETRNSRRLH